MPSKRVPRRNTLETQPLL